jgi:hypothetical protein
MSTSAPQDIVHASVVAGGTHDESTHYQRAGRGASVILLSGDGTTANALLAGLPRHFRLIAPNVPASLAVTGGDFQTWLRGFLDALGVTRAAIVAGPCFAAQVLGFSLMEPERVGQIVFLIGPCGTSFGADGERGVVDRLEKAGQSLLVVPLDQTDPAAFARSLASIEAFLCPAESQS